MARVWRSMLRSLALGLGVAAVGCSSAPRGGVDAASQVAAPGFLGDWDGPNGARVHIERNGTDAFAIRVDSSGESRRYTGHLLEIDGQRLAEILAFDPAASDTRGVPVYAYGRVERTGDRFTYAPLSAEWLRRAAEGSPGVRYESTASVVRGSGGAVVSDPAAMRALLSRALKDPSAFGPPEVFTRAR
jgi:hypothetical protein